MLRPSHAFASVFPARAGMSQHGLAYRQAIQAFSPRERG